MAWTRIPAVAPHGSDSRWESARAVTVVVSSIVLIFAPLMTWWRVDVSGMYTFSESGRWFTAGRYVQIAGVLSVALGTLFCLRSMRTARRYLALALAAVAILTFGYLINFVTDTSHLNSLFAKSINDPVPASGTHISPGAGLVVALLADFVLVAISVLETVRAIRPPRPFDRLAR